MQGRHWKEKQLAEMEVGVFAPLFEPCSFPPTTLNLTFVNLRTGARLAYLQGRFQYYHTRCARAVAAAFLERSWPAGEAATGYRTSWLQGALTYSARSMLFCLLSPHTDLVGAVQAITVQLANRDVVVRTRGSLWSCCFLRLLFIGYRRDRFRQDGRVHDSAHCVRERATQAGATQRR